MWFSNSLMAFIMATLGGFALIFGGAIPLLFSKIRSYILSLILSFTAGVILYAAFVRFYPSSLYVLRSVYPQQEAALITTISFFIGLLITFPIDIILNFKQRRFRHREANPDKKKKHEHQLSLLIFLSITIHSFIEGMATYLTYISEAYVAIPVILSLIAHNIPEGAVISMVIFKKSQNKRKAMLLLGITALAIPLGAFLSYIILRDTWDPRIFGIMKGVLAGLLVNASLNEMIPGAEMRASHKLSMRGVFVGMLFMAVILLTLVH